MFKYLGFKPLVQVESKSSGDSHFLSSLMKVKGDFLCYGSFVVKDFDAFSSLITIFFTHHHVSPIT